MYVLAAALALRLLNPHDVAVDATLRCGDETRNVRLAARELRDVEGCVSADALVPVVAIETSLDEEQSEWQQLVDADAECGTAPMAAPLFACRNGTATAFVSPVDGASYAWTAEGATILGSATAPRIALQLGDAATVKLTCTITTADCTKTAAAAIAVREPIVVKSFTVPATANANEPLTISWSFEPGREPATQLLTGDLFAQPVTLAPTARSYTVTPQNGGMRAVELRASYAKTIAVAPPPKKRRRSVGGGVTATECPSALATARVDVKGCVIREPVVNAPEDIPAGETFQVTIADLEDGQKVQWSADNGTITYVSPFGERVLVAAGVSGKTDVHARVERAAGCFADSSASVAILQPANQCALPPAATLMLQASDCDSATVRASFTGTPPFAGRWSDGTDFRTMSNFVHHDFPGAGTYGMTAFHDASCFGAVSGAPSMAALKPSVKIEGVEGCAGGQVKATFTGNPPFSGTWSDGQPFTTSATTLTRTVPEGTWSIANVTDANCSAIKAGSNSVTFGPAPRAYIQPNTGNWNCENPYGQDGSFGIVTTGGRPPYVWELSDGTTMTSSSYAATRAVRPGEAYGKTYELKRATAAGCEATLGSDRFATIYLRLPVWPPAQPSKVCTNTDITIAGLGEGTPMGQVFPSEGTLITWQATGTAKPEIVSGQGTPSMTFRGGQGDASILFTTQFADSHCNASGTIKYRLVDKPVLQALYASPATIPRWGSTTISWSMNGTPDFLGISAAGNRAPDVQRLNNSCCSATFVDTKGPGVVPITLRWLDCAGEHTETINVTITE